ncbi:ComEA family DNA-binding protein [Thermovenabulum gondwanense]|uniref:ComE operon protein 1 n=1 Tax=Thermovenabulum gondwanense TaxID=520767 RepID=A0A162M9V0_9FIRM|nr:ComEA family DNA-binding protein [Thermovenabulum gondwanense]KYO64745.1 ComE operon protein 1 [Thermovenabulum gondwanense]
MMGEKFNLSKREKILVLIILVLVFLLVFFFKNMAGQEEVAFKLEGAENLKDPEIMEKEIFVYITGAVKNPGVYKLRDGDRVKDLVEIAGGLDENADLLSVNLAKKLTDEEKIHIPRVDESGSEKSVKDGRININTADETELDKLPGIGPSLAKRIIDYRNTHGPFKKIDEIKNVAGIGDKKFQDIKDLIKTE